MTKHERNKWTPPVGGEEQERDDNSAAVQMLSSMDQYRHKDSRKDFIKMELLYHQMHLNINEIYREEIRDKLAVSIWKIIQRIEIIMVVITTAVNPKKNKTLHRERQ